MMVATPPYVLLLEKMREMGAAVDYFDRAGLEGTVTIRHARNRNPTREERPTIGILLVSDDEQDGESARNESESAREMIVDLIADVELTTEESRADPTGLLFLGRFVAAFVEGLKDPLQPNRWLGGLCDIVFMGALEPDDRASPEAGRMTRAIHVVYRVRADDPNVLLADGDDG